jgi:single-strand DNA-binding protein
MTNIVILSGNLGNDPETSTTAGGIAIAHMSLATSRPRYVDGKIARDGNGRAELTTEWHRVVAFENIAKAAEKCVKGMKILVIGRNKTTKWQDRDGNDRYTTEVIAETIEFLAWPKRGKQKDRDIDPDDDINF